MPEPTLQDLDIHSPDLYVSRGYPWREWDLLRREAPVFWYERESIDPFWAITRHADILTVSKRSDVFVNSRRLRLQDRAEDQRQSHYMRLRAEAMGWDPKEPHDFIFMDDPRHRNFRLIPARRFTPAALDKLEDHFDQLSLGFAEELRSQLDEAAQRGEPCDFVRAFAEKLPLAAIGEMLGLPPGDWQRLKVLTNVLIGAPEPDFEAEGEDRQTSLRRAVAELLGYNLEVIEKRRADGAQGDDVASLLLRGKVDGKPLTDQQLLGYLNLLLVAGNETTRNALTGGVQALLEHPEERDRLCANPELVTSAVEEMLRWTSPVVQFARTAVEDFELAGVRIRAGDDVGIWYPSANRDEAVFSDPYRFDITRSPNHHLAFGGYGAHFCLGANLARWEMRAALRALLPILPSMELAGPEQRIPFLHVPAIHALPVRLAA
ncbi:MAG: cytochrome [Deltaproteobacteria bacterium]|nr:cytochrome [Deltaproteobacteria bacterium]